MLYAIIKSMDEMCKNEPYISIESHSQIIVLQEVNLNWCK